jgi:hypothetical protein
VCAVTLLFVTPVAAGVFENAVRAQWRGAWVLTDTEVYSECDGSFDTNKVSGSLVTHRGGMRFLPGELGQVQRVQMKKRKVELMISLDVPARIARQDGPFTLYEHRACAVSLEIDVPRDVTKDKDVESVDRIAAGVVRRYATREAAVASGGWNAREPEPMPEDYAVTLARHAAWKAEQTNRAVDDRRRVAMEQIKLAGTTIDSDPDYLQGLASGVEAMRRWSEQDCPRLLGRDFAAVRRAVPEERRAETETDERWRRGYADGQRLVYHIYLVERLDRCYVDVPALPNEAGREMTSRRIP